MVLNAVADKKLYQMDLETGKIVLEVFADGVNNLLEMTYGTKLDEFSHNSQVLAIN